MTGMHFPGPPGFHVPGNEFDGRIDGKLVNENDVKEVINELKEENEKLKNHHYNHHKQSEIKHLNQYTGYFGTPEGDFPVSVVADTIYQAAKILRMPGAFDANTNEPHTIKFIKGTVIAAVPVRTAGFNVVIDPKGAEESGAYATPVHADVTNGTEVIFTAFEPFGWKFIGWYKGDQLISTEKVSSIEVYDPYSSLIQYVAKYEFDPILRNGRYLELGNGWYFDFKFDGYSNYEGKMIFHSGDAPDYHFVISKYDENSGQVVLIANPSVVQAQDIGMTVTLTPTAIGFNLVINNVTINNPWNLITDQVLSLKWVGNI